MKSLGDGNYLINFSLLSSVVQVLVLLSRAFLRVQAQEHESDLEHRVHPHLQY